MKLFKIINLMFVFFQKISIIFELIILKLKYKKVQFFNKGKGGFNKYIINDEILLKKNNILLVFKIWFNNILTNKPQIYIKNRFKYLKYVIKLKNFSKVNLCYRVNKEGLFFKYLKDAETLDDSNYCKGNMMKIFKGISDLHKHGFYFRDLSQDNIIISGDDIYLIDIESINPLNKKIDKDYDYRYLLRSINDVKLRNKIKKLLVEKNIIKK